MRPVPTFGAAVASSGECRKRHTAAPSVGRDSVGKISAVCENAAEVQELRLVVRRLAASIMWDHGAVILGKRTPERIVEQTVDMPAPQIALQHAHFGREPFGRDGRKYFDGEDSKDLIKYPPLTPVPHAHERTVDQPGDQARAEIPQTQNVDEVVDVRVVMQRQVPQVQTVPNTVEVPPVPFVGRVVDVPVIVVTKHVEIPQTYYIDHVVDVSVVVLQQVPQVQTVAKTVEAPLRQFVGRVVDGPVIMQVRQCRPGMSPLRTPRICDYKAVVSVNGLTQVTNKFWCCRATHMFRRRPTKIRGLPRSLCRPHRRPGIRSPSVQPCARLKPCSGYHRCCRPPATSERRLAWVGELGRGEDVHS